MGEVLAKTEAAPAEPTGSCASSRALVDLRTPEKPLRVGELARRTGKTVRALHLYEEIGLLRPMHRTKGGFRLFSPASIARVQWIDKLKDAGFSLQELRQFIDAVGDGSASTAMRRVHDVFAQRLAEIRAQLGRLAQLETDLVESLEYLEGCRTCGTSEQVQACGSCGQPSHAGKSQPLLVAGIQRG